MGEINQRRQERERAGKRGKSEEIWVETERVEGGGEKK